MLAMFSTVRGCSWTNGNVDILIANQRSAPWIVVIVWPAIWAPGFIHSSKIVLIWLWAVKYDIGHALYSRRLFAVRPFVFGRPRQAGRRSSGASVLASVPDRRQSGVPDGQIAAPFPIGFVGNSMKRLVWRRWYRFHQDLVRPECVIRGFCGRIMSTKSIVWPMVIRWLIIGTGFYGFHYHFQCFTRFHHKLNDNHNNQQKGENCFIREIWLHYS